MPIERLLKAFLEVQRVDVTADSLRLWCDAFSDLTAEQVADALRRYNREAAGEFPTPANVRKYAGGGEASTDDRAGIAWACVRRQLSRVGAYESITFDDHITNAAIRHIGGWESLCAVETDRVQWKEKEFVAAYKTIVRTGLGDASPLGGIVARTNGKLGHAAPTPRLIRTGLSPHPIAKRLESPASKQKRLAAHRPTLNLKGPEA